MNNKFPHESEVIEFRSPVSKPCSELWKSLKDTGFNLAEDVWFLQRDEPVENWQSVSYGSVSVFFQNEELFLTTEEANDPDEKPQWDKVEIKYLLATLPEEMVDRFVAKIESLAVKLELPIRYKNEEISAANLGYKLHAFCRELDEEFGGPGSKIIRQFIELHYS